LSELFDGTVRTFWVLDAKELGNVDGLGISTGNHDRKVGAGNTAIVGLGTVDRSLDLDTDVEGF
jgi:hypothetical protein